MVRRGDNNWVTVIELKPLPPGKDGRLEWECAVVSDEQGILEGFRVWIAAEDAKRLLRPQAAAERWVTDRVEDFAQRDFASLQAASPLRLRP